MIKNARILKKFEREYLKREKLSFKDKLKIFESMWKEARALGVIKKTDRLEGIEKAVKIAKIANGM